MSSESIGSFPVIKHNEFDIGYYYEFVIFYLIVSGVATGGSRGQNAPLDSENFAKIGGKEGENQGKNEREKEEKSGRKRNNREGSSFCPS